jgi:pimeloyl-ACP methyl ester carboxylesterase
MFTEVVSDRGSGPVVVYVPGIDGTGNLLMSTADRLEQRFRLLRLRYVLGVNEKNQTYEHLAKSLVQTVSLRGVDSMILLAESFGGAVAMQAALDHADRVQALALVNTFPRFHSRLQLGLSSFGSALVPAWLVAWGRRNLAPRLLFGGHRDAAAADSFRNTDAGWKLDEGYRARFRMIRGLDGRDASDR